MEAPPDPGPHASASASAAAPLRALEVARLREQQKKVTGRASAGGLGRRLIPDTSSAHGSLSPGLGLFLAHSPWPTPSRLTGPQPSGQGPSTISSWYRAGVLPLGPERESGRNFCHVLLLSLFVWSPLTFEGRGGVGKRDVTICLTCI